MLCCLKVLCILLHPLFLISSQLLGIDQVLSVNVGYLTNLIVPALWFLELQHIQVVSCITLHDETNLSKPRLSDELVPHVVDVLNWSGRFTDWDLRQRTHILIRVHQEHGSFRESARIHVRKHGAPFETVISATFSVEDSQSAGPRALHDNNTLLAFIMLHSVVSQEFRAHQ